MEGTTSAAPASSPAPSSAPAPSAAPSTPSAAPASSPASSGAPTTPTPGTAAAPTQPVPPTPPEPKRYRYKSGDVEADIEADLVDNLAKKMGLSPEEILKGAQMSRSSYQRWQEAKKLRDEAEKSQAEWKKRYEDPRITAVKAKDASLSDDEAWALVKTQELYERSQMNPDQRALMDERQRREQLEKQAKDREESEKKARLAGETKVEAAKLDRGLTEALQKHQLPKNPAWARAVLDHLAAAARAGEVPDVEGAVLYVKRRVQADDRSRFTAMPDEQLETWLGQDVINRILKRSVEKARGGVQPTVPTPPPAPQTKVPEERVFLSEAEWHAKYRDF
jgi:hypothetical protein